MEDFFSFFMKTFGLIGYPLEHSYSKFYFTEKFNKECNRQINPMLVIITLSGLPYNAKIPNILSCFL